MSGTTPLPNWQKTIADGFKVGEIFTMAAGRNAGKSMFNPGLFQKMFNDMMTNRPITDLVLEENRVNGSRYHTVEPVGGHWSDMEKWCLETFGEPGEIWPTQDFAWPEAPRWMQNNRKFWFRNLKDRDWFIMRWRA